MVARNQSAEIKMLKEALVLADEKRKQLMALNKQLQQELNECIEDSEAVENPRKPSSSKTKSWSFDQIIRGDHMTKAELLVENRRLKRLVQELRHGLEEVTDELNSLKKSRSRTKK